jgi:hypothetical protein
MTHLDGIMSLAVESFHQITYQLGSGPDEYMWWVY